MVEDITSETLGLIKNKAFRAYAQTYADIEADFRESVRSFGLDFAGAEEAHTDRALDARTDALASLGVRVENDRKSFVWNWISPACLTCRKGVGTETFLSSVQCPRNCFFCFNPNQEDYDYYLTHVHDMAGELQGRHDQGVRYVDLALTGGEPLLHPRESIAFFQKAAELYPDAYTRLYTSGSGLDENVLAELVGAGLKEIRFSVKMEDSPALIDATLRKIASCRGRIPCVMVEMPVMPDQVPQMQELLVRLDELGIDGINLLELCFPLHNASEFSKRGYRLKHRPYRVLYNYFYAGGLPIAGSEEACLDLVEFAARQGLRMGVHYCSLENKFTGQVYQQNRFIHAAREQQVMSERDYFLKSAKVFGRDVAAAEHVLRTAGEQRLAYDAGDQTLEFPLESMSVLAQSRPNMEVAVCLYIAEQRDEGPVLRELGIQRTTAASFDPQTDL